MTNTNGLNLTATEIKPQKKKAPKRYPVEASLVILSKIENRISRNHSQESMAPIW
ncbi:hypothetical protein RTCCBAU85039_6141 [Rhizobium tibeticum]|uniref:Uncharacterized protein n=1 Tax=Rhizobium tibeticum TaxID=501024 RepID=A0A1K0KLF9_9HYPH|nr:hypothetical protein RTCCBAU85039_6141 [Rhizobium tibeticum]